jgi:methyltransferase (TIGR00027 family)
MPNPAAQCISDTALWVAYYRALETERPDAVFRDPYARRLAGHRGEQVARELGRGKSSAWSFSVRTATLDDLVLGAVSAGADSVVNLAAGLDTRPYRLSLPARLQWIEIDLRDIISYKQEVLEKETPRCQLERIALDLLDVTERRRLFTRINHSAAKTLVLTEGLLVYLHPEEVAALAADLHAQCNFQYWITNISSPAIVQRSSKLWGEKLNAAKAPLQFAAGPEFFRPHGWELAEFRELFQEGRRLNREMPGAWILHVAERVFPVTFKNRMQKFRSGSMLMKRIGIPGESPGITTQSQSESDRLIGNQHAAG